MLTWQDTPGWWTDEHPRQHYNFCITKLDHIVGSCLLYTHYLFLFCFIVSITSMQGAKQSCIPVKSEYTKALSWHVRAMTDETYFYRNLSDFNMSSLDTIKFSGFPKLTNLWVQIFFNVHFLHGLLVTKNASIVQKSVFWLFTDKQCVASQSIKQLEHVQSHKGRFLWSTTDSNIVSKVACYTKNVWKTRTSVLHSLTMVVIKKIIWIVHACIIHVCLYIYTHTEREWYLLRILHFTNIIDDFVHLNTGPWAVGSSLILCPMMFSAPCGTWHNCKSPCWCTYLHPIRVHAHLVCWLWTWWAGIWWTTHCSHPLILVLLMGCRTCNPCKHRQHAYFLLISYNARICVQSRYVKNTISQMQRACHCFHKTIFFGTGQKPGT